MRYLKIFPLLFTLLTFQTIEALDQKSEESIKEIIQNYIDCWNNHSGRGFADHFSENADFINIFGMHLHGKVAIQKWHDEILNTFLKGSTFTLTELKLREVQPGLVLAFVRWEVEGICSGEGREVVNGIFSHVFIHHEDSWKITATQGTRSL